MNVHHCSRWRCSFGLCVDEQLNRKIRDEFKPEKKTRLWVQQHERSERALTGVFMYLGDFGLLTDCELTVSKQNKPKKRSFPEKKMDLLCGDALSSEFKQVLTDVFADIAHNSNETISIADMRNYIITCVGEGTKCSSDERIRTIFSEHGGEEKDRSAMTRLCVFSF